MTASDITASYHHEQTNGCSNINAISVNQFCASGLAQHMTTTNNQTKFLTTTSVHCESLELKPNPANPCRAAASR
jgi:hypothetical protein